MKVHILKVIFKVMLRNIKVHHHPQHSAACIAWQQQSFKIEVLFELHIILAFFCICCIYGEQNELE